MIRVKCPYCDGTGRHPTLRDRDGYAEDCGRCWGLGYILSSEDELVREMQHSEGDFRDTSIDYTRLSNKGEE